MLRPFQFSCLRELILDDGGYVLPRSFYRALPPKFLTKVDLKVEGMDDVDLLCICNESLRHLSLTLVTDHDRNNVTARGLTGALSLSPSLNHLSLSGFSVSICVMDRALSGPIASQLDRLHLDGFLPPHWIRPLTFLRRLDSSCVLSISRCGLTDGHLPHGSLPSNCRIDIAIVKA